MKKIGVPLIYLVILFYILKEFTSGYDQRSVTPNLLFAANIVSFICLTIANIYNAYIKYLSERSVLIQDKDGIQFTLERKSYSVVIWIQVSLSISFITLLIGFLLVRDSYASIAFYAAVLFIVSIIALGLSMSLMRFTHPGFKLPNPTSPTYQQELFDSFDDGEKYMMLKSLYKLYFLIIGALVLLAFGLMYYSAFTGNSQLNSIIGIGTILLFVQTYYSISLKPKRI